MTGDWFVICLAVPERCRPYALLEKRYFSRILPKILKYARPTLRTAALSIECSLFAYRW